MSVSTTLRMFDQMTGPLQQVTSALNLTISSMDDLSNSANKDLNITQNLDSARTAIRNAEAGFRQMSDEVSRATGSQNNMNNSMKQGSSIAGSLTGKVKGLVGAYLGFQTIKKGLEMTIGGATNLERQLITISGMLGNKDVGKAFFGQLNDYANVSAYGLEEFAGISRQFIQFTKNTDKIMGLNKLSERLAFLDPTQGLEGAGFALKEILGGDGMSLKGRFGFGSDEIKALKSATDMDDFTNKFNEMLNLKGATQQAVDEVSKSFSALGGNLLSSMGTKFAKAGEGALNALKPLLAMLNEGFREGQFDGFFNGLSLGLSWVASGIAWVVDSAFSLGGAIKDNWGMIEPIVWGIVAAIGAYALVLGIYNTQQAISNGLKAWVAFQESVHAAALMMSTGSTFAATAAQHGLNAALYACPLTWIILAIIVVIGVIYLAVAVVNHFAGTSVSATGIIVGVFFMLGAAIFNIIASLWNIFSIFVEFIANVFNHPVYSIMMLFANMAINLVDNLISISDGADSVATAIANAFIWGANKAIGAVNWIIDALNSIPGIDIGKVGNIGKMESFTSSLKGFKGKIQATMNAIRPDNYVVTQKLDKKSLGGAFQNGYNIGEGLSNKFSISNLTSGFGSDVGKNSPNTDNILNDFNAKQNDNFGGANDPLGKANKGIGDANKGLDDANKNLKGINDKLDVSNEHLQMMRDMAEKEAVKNFVTLSPTVKVTHTGNINNGYDIDTIVGRIEEKIDIEIAAGAKEVYNLG